MNLTKTQKAVYNMCPSQNSMATKITPLHRRLNWSHIHLSQANLKKTWPKIEINVFIIITICEREREISSADPIGKFENLIALRYK